MLSDFRVTVHLTDAIAVLRQFLRMAVLLPVCLSN